MKQIIIVGAVLLLGLSVFQAVDVVRVAVCEYSVDRGLALSDLCSDMLLNDLYINIDVGMLL